jgi:putative iron-dependent peroxidase
MESLGPTSLCARRLWVIEKMFERMSMGHPSGLHDRLLDFSRPLTGNIFFAPSATVMNRLDG